MLLGGVKHMLEFAPIVNGYDCAFAPPLRQPHYITISQGAGPPRQIQRVIDSDIFRLALEQNLDETGVRKEATVRYARERVYKRQKHTYYHQRQIPVDVRKSDMRL